MADRYEVISARLSSDTAVTAHLSDRIFPLLAPEGTPAPYCVLSTNGAQPARSKDGFSGRITWQMAVTIYAKSSDVSREIATAVRSCLDHYIDLAQGVHITRYESEADGYDFNVNLYLVNLQFAVPMEGQA